VLSRHELQEVVILLSKFITQVALVLPSKADHKLNAVGITYATMMKSMLKVDPFKCILCGGRMVFNHFEAGMKLRGLVLNLKSFVLQKTI
jgi:hypothetical protein